MEEIKNKIKICIEPNENENKTTQNLWDSVREVLTLITIQAYFKKHKNQINNLILHLKQLEKEEIKNPRVSRRKEIIKFRAEVNEKETKETVMVFVDQNLGTGVYEKKDAGEPSLE